MTLFLFTGGLEIKREIMIGELASLRRAILPVTAAIGIIFLFTGITSKALNTLLSSGVTWSHILGVSSLGGIGLTISIFISALSLASTEFTDLAKFGIIVGSLVSALLGFAVPEISFSTGSARVGFPAYDRDGRSTPCVHAIPCLFQE